LGYSGIRIYSVIYSSYSAPGSRIGGIEIQIFRNENSSQTNAYSHYSNYSYSGLIPNESALRERKLAVITPLHQEGAELFSELGHHPVFLTSIVFEISKYCFRQHF